MKRKLLIGALVFILLGAGAMYFIFESGGIEVQASDVEIREFGRTVSTSGYLVAVRERTLSSSQNMMISGLVIDVGDEVTAGQLLLSGDARDLETERRTLLAEITSLEASLGVARGNLPSQVASAQSRLAAARLEVEQASEDLERTTSLYEAGAVPETQLRTATARVAAAEASLGTAESNLTEISSRRVMIDKDEAHLEAMRAQVQRIDERIDDHRITSPGDYLVTDVYVEEGDMVAAGAPLALLQSREIRVEAEIIAQDARSVALDQRVILSGDALAGEFEARISKIHPRAVERVSELGVTQRRVPVEAVLVEVPEGVSSGYPVDLDIIVEEARGLSISRDAVFSMAGTDHAFVIRDARAHLVEVQTGLEGDDYWEIVSGLEEGDRVVINPPRELEDGSRVRTATPE